MVSVTSTPSISCRSRDAEVIIYSATYYYSVALPKALDKDQTASLVLETVQAHAAYPFPPEAAQDDRQALKYDTDLFVLSPYKSLTQTIRFKLVD
jgi:oligosaccharyltransferase complex subunit alpha (ribophorin I)